MAFHMATKTDNFRPSPGRGHRHSRSACLKVVGAAIFATVNEGHSLSKHAQPLRSVHANRTSGATR
jgi:hypothetical protein